MLKSIDAISDDEQVGTILATQRVTTKDYHYRGDVIVGWSKGERFIIFTRLPVDMPSGERPRDHVCPSHIPPGILIAINAALKTWKAELPSRTAVAKRLIELTFNLPN